MKSLHSALADFTFEQLPPAWTTVDLASFSRGKSLWDYQQAALQNALKALWKYYGEDVMESPAEIASLPLPRNDERKRRFFQWYMDNRIELDEALNLGKKRDNTTMLAPFYPVEDNKISYHHLINRMGFWMATGSGKTLVIVKILELLYTLMQRREIPGHDVMVLTHREDLLQQLRDHVNDFNAGGRTPHIRLRELREYPEVKRGMGSLFADELTVFYYRSDNLSDEQKERIIDFRNYDNNGKWYVLLDEAHKGDREDSKRQHIYSILSRNGFLFNFSATFTDSRDIRSTAYEFNLASFIERGYGKHISLLKQENRAFRDKEDYTNEEKQRIVLQSLLMLAYVAKSRENLCTVANAPLFHRPLLLALVNSVNTEESDLKLFFRELERIAKGEITAQAFTAAKQVLRAELATFPQWLYESERFDLCAEIFDSLKKEDILRHVFNADEQGDIEVLIRPSNDKEMAFKLKTSDSPFALIKIGQTAEWLKVFLAGYEIVKGFEDESFFSRLNDADSEINLLMGSRSFYEGWDSNRPNVITFINIGVGTDARKFILQSVGRGVRIEPLPNRRRRLENLCNVGEADKTLYQQAKPYLSAVQSLFIFGTKREALAAVFDGLAQERMREEGIELALDVNESALCGYPLLIPVYRRLDGTLLVQQRNPRKFELQVAEQQQLRHYVDYLGDDRLLLARHGLMPQQIALLQQTLATPETYFNPHTTRRYGSYEIMLPRLAQYFAVIPNEVQGFKPLEEEIRHFKHIRVHLKDLEELRRKIDAVRRYKNPRAEKEELKNRLREKAIDIDEYTQAVEELAKTEQVKTFEHNGHRLHIKNIAAHYYLPLLHSDDDKIDYISRIITTPSEIRFVKQLEEYLKESPNLFEPYDWWLFSRAEETMDKIIIPYYDPIQNKIRDFHPDFIFWLVKGTEYTILFVDPKGMTVADYQHKIDGYKTLFRNAQGDNYRIFTYDTYQVKVALALYTDDANLSPLEYMEYWYDNPKTMLGSLMKNIR